jgi:diguanylate cyclase (GGDEF)-like protein
MAGLLALAAVGAATVLVAATWFFARRAEARRSRERVAVAVDELTARVEELSAELERALRRAEHREAHGDLGVLIDLDDLLARIVDLAVSFAGVDAAVVSVEADETEHPVAAAGMSIAQAREETLAATARPGAELRSRLALPLEGEAGQLGFVAVYSRPVRDLAGEHLGALEDLAERAGPAVENALRYREARRLADLDALTGLRNRRFFHETLQRECARAQRYERRLALLVLDIDDFKSINERLGHLAGDGVLAEAGSRLDSVLRASDIACRVGGDEFAIILPEGGPADAEHLYRRIQAAVSERPIGRVDRLSFSAGIAELRAKDDASSFFERADDALYRAKNAGKGRVLSADERPG